MLLLTMLALLAAGCGGDDTSDATGGTDTAAVEETTTDSTETMDDATETTAEDEDATLSGECAEFAGLGAKITQAMSGAGNEGLDEASALFDELASQVPDEIQADFEVVAENFSKIAEAMKDVDLTSGATPSPEDLAKLQELTESLDSEEVRQASENIEAWAQENC